VVVIGLLILGEVRIGIFVPVYAHPSERFRLDRKEPINRIISKYLREIVVAIDIVLISMVIDLE